MGVSKFNYHPYKALRNKKNGMLQPLFKNKYHLRSQFYQEMYQIFLMERCIGIN